MEKVFWNLRTLETFLNPQNAPLFVFNIIKVFNEADKKLISELYKKLSEYEIVSFGLGVEYNEEEEAKFIKKVSEDWKEIVVILRKIHTAMGKNLDKKDEKQNTSYFG